MARRIAWSWSPANSLSKDDAKLKRISYLVVLVIRKVDFHLGNPLGCVRFSAPSAGNPGAPVLMGGQLPVTVNPSDVDSKVMIEGAEVMVKGIIAPMDGSALLVLLKVGDTTKGYRVGDEFAPGMTLTAISETKISVQIGNSTVKAGVGQAVKPA